MGNHNQPVRQVAAVSLTVALLSLSVGVNAQPSKRDQAIAHYNQAEAYFKAGTFDKAAIEYGKAYALEAQPGLLFNLGLAHENHGARDSAIAAYDRYLSEAPTGDKATEARARVTALKRSRDQELAKSNQLRELRAQSDELIADGKHIEAVAKLRELHQANGESAVLYEIAVAYENGGEYELARIEYERYITTGDTAHATEAAARKRALDDKNKPDGDGNTGAGKTGDGTVGSGPVGGVPGGDVQDGRRSPTALILPAAATAVTVGLFGTGALFGLRAGFLENELLDQLEGKDPPLDNSDPRIDEGRSAVKTANILYIASGVAAAATGYLWWRYFASSPTAEPSVSVTPFIDPSGSGVAIGGSF